MKNYIQDGDVLTLIAPAGGVVGGMIYKISSIIAVATASEVAGQPFEASTKGVYELPKVTADAPAQGAKAYLLADGTAITTVSTANTLIGVFTEARVNGDTLCFVRLNGIGV